MGFDQIRITKARGGSSLLTKEDKALLARLDRQSEDMLAWLAQQRRDFDSHTDHYR